MSRPTNSGELQLTVANLLIARDLINEEIDRLLQPFPSLNEEIEYFEDNIEAIQRSAKDADKTAVVIRGTEVVGFFDTVVEAAQFGYVEFKGDLFLARDVRPDRATATGGIPTLIHCPKRWKDRYGEDGDPRPAYLDDLDGEAICVDHGIVGRFTKQQEKR